MFSSPITRSRTPAVARPRSEPTLAATLAPIERLRLTTASAAAAPTLPANTPIAAALRTMSTGLVERGSTRSGHGPPALLGDLHQAVVGVQGTGPPDRLQEGQVLAAVGVPEGLVEVDLVLLGELRDGVGLALAPADGACQGAGVATVVVDLHLRADDVVDTEVVGGCLDLRPCGRGGDHHRVVPAQVRVDERARVGVDHLGDLLGEDRARPALRLIGVAPGLPLHPHVHQLGDVVPAALHVDALSDRAHELLGGDLAALEPIGEEGCRGVARDQGAVEVEEGPDVWTLGGVVDLLDQPLDVSHVTLPGDVGRVRSAWVAPMPGRSGAACPDGA